MDRGQRLGSELGLDRRSTLLGHAEIAAEERLRRGRAEGDEYLGLDRRELGLEPGTAGGDLAPVRLRVDPALAARCPLEVLDDVRHVGGAAVDSSILERLIEQSAGGADERLSLTVLAVSRLLPDQHQPCGGSPGAEHGLRSRPPQLACGAARGSFAKRFQARSRRNQLGDVRQEFLPGCV